MENFLLRLKEDMTQYEEKNSQFSRLCDHGLGFGI